MKPAIHLNAIPEPWHYNPSKWSQRICISCVAAIAFLIAVYMGLYQWRLIDQVWDPVFGAASSYVPDSVMDAIYLKDSVVLGLLFFDVVHHSRSFREALSLMAGI